MKAWVIAFQQYRLSGKFTLNEDGYNNMAKLLAIILNEVSLLICNIQRLTLVL